MLKCNSRKDFPSLLICVRFIVFSHGFTKTHGFIKREKTVYVLTSSKRTSTKVPSSSSFIISLFSHHTLPFPVFSFFPFPKRLISFHTFVHDGLLCLLSRSIPFISSPSFMMGFAKKAMKFTIHVRWKFEVESV